MSCDEIRELLEGYALGVLEPQEQARVEAHLESCADCRALAAAYHELLAGLPDALALASPLGVPETIKQRLLATISSGAAPAAEPVSALPRSRRRGGVMRRVLALAGAVAFALALASTAALGLAFDRERQLRERFAGLLDQREIVLEVVDGRGTERAVLRPAGTAADAYGKVFTNPRLSDVIVMAGRLPTPAQGEEYRVLMTRRGVTRSVGILKVNAKGFGLLVFAAERSGPRYDAARVVLQPANARSPQRQTVLAWTRSR